MKNLLLNYFNRYNSPKRERVIGFWMCAILASFLLLMNLLVSCSSVYQCPTYSGSRDHHPAYEKRN